MSGAILPLRRRAPGRSGMWLSMIGLSAALVLLITAASGCGQQRPRQMPRSAVVVVRCPVKDASLWVDGRYIGPLAALRGGVRLRPGTHRIEVRDDGYHSYYGELTLAPKQRRQLRVVLARAFR